MNLCALHCELRNTEQLLISLGMFAYDCGSLKDCNLYLNSKIGDYFLRCWLCAFGLILR